MQSSAQPKPVPAALDADCIQWTADAGMLSMFASVSDTSAIAAAPPPILLLHSINAAGSAAEMAPLFGYYRNRRSVYALDLPGFGASERSDRIYSPRLMTDAVVQALHRIAVANGGAAVDVIALSLAGEFAARAQMEHPALVRRLALISPTGFNGVPRRYGPPGSTLGLAWLQRFLSNPLWSARLYNGLTRPGVIRYFLQRSWGSKHIDEGLWAYDVLITRQPGARFAPLYFLSAHLFSADINAVYEALTCPVWVSMATRGDFVRYEGRSSLTARSNWQFHLVEGGALPHFEDLAAFTARLDPFLAPA